MGCIGCCTSAVTLWEMTGEGMEVVLRFGISCTIGGRCVSCWTVVTGGITDCDGAMLGCVGVVTVCDC